MIAIKIIFAFLLYLIFIQTIQWNKDRLTNQKKLSEPTPPENEEVGQFDNFDMDK